MKDIITSRDNDRVKLLAALLGRKKERDERGLFALEGLRLCRDAVEFGLEPELLFLTPQAAEKHPETTALLDAAEQTVWISPELAQKVADTKSTQGVFAVLRQKPHDVDGMETRSDGRYLLLSGLQDPGNLGTVLRTAHCLGMDGALLSGCPDIYSPKVLRSAMGAVWRLPIAVCPSMEEQVDRLRGMGLRVYAAALREDAVPVHKAQLGRGCCVLIGNEGAGLPGDLAEACTGSVIIPMAGGADSLNAASAATVLLWEMARGNLV